MQTLRGGLDVTRVARRRAAACLLLTPLPAEGGGVVEKQRKSSPESRPALPVKLHAASNGEFAPVRDATVERAIALAHARADEAARKVGRSRRDFLRSSCGVAATLLAVNEASGCLGAGGYFLREDTAYDEDAATQALGGEDFIFDVQTHHVSPERDWFWRNGAAATLTYIAPQARCGESPFVECFSQDHYLKELFLDSDTDVAVLSVLPGDDDESPLRIEEMAETRALVEKLDGSPRLLLHGFLAPQRRTRAELNERIAELAEGWKVAALKLYPIGGPEGDGYWLDDPARGLPIFEEAMRVGVRTVAVHKGLPLPFTDGRYAACRDVGSVARMFPELKLLIYHAGYEPTRREGPYDPTAERGVDRLLRDLEENGIGANGNVWVDIGSTWRQLMGRPEQAAHVLGKLLLYLGEDRILWGTDSILYGSPQDQIQAFRAFQIGSELRERYGYPALTPRVKAKIFGLNAAAVYGVDPTRTRERIARDSVAQAREGYVPRPSFETYGPRTRRELLGWLRSRGGAH